MNLNMVSIIEVSWFVLNIVCNNKKTLNDGKNAKKNII